MHAVETYSARASISGLSTFTARAAGVIEADVALGSRTTVTPHANEVFGSTAVSLRSAASISAS